MKASEIDIVAAFAGQQSAHHRGPQDAGSADRYYGRPCRPNFTYQGKTFDADEMTAEQRRIYEKAWTEEQDRKNQWRRG